MKTIAITGALGYSGRYMTEVALDKGFKVLGLTNSPVKPNPRNIPLAPLEWNNREALADSLRGCSTLINTYWVRFTHKKFSHEKAIEHTKTLFEAAKQAGIERIVHVSITNPDLRSPLPYFKGKAKLEDCLQKTGIPHSILRPAVLFGENPGEDILINNMVWSLRNFPIIGLFGKGDYRLQPIHVKDFAELALRACSSKASHEIIQAIGPETYTFKELFAFLGNAIQRPRPLISVPPRLAYLATTIMGYMQGDVMLTWDEVRGLMEDRLAVDDTPSTVRRKLSDWAHKHADELGVSYSNELKRRH